MTGEEKWRVSREEKTNYSTPYIWKNKVRTELIAGGKSARSYDPATGKLLWELKAGGETTIPSATGDEDQLYIGNTGGQNAKSNLFAVRAGAEGDITPEDSLKTGEWLSWIFRDAALGNSSPLLYNGNLYVIGSRGGEVKCINTTNGNLVYKERISGTAAVWASPWAFNDKIWFFDEKGITRSFSAGEKFGLVDENRLDGKFWASVAITSDAYVFRGVEAIFCVKK
ncbi:hypothetical protein EHM76_06270 [bacterium]|nr:MAG: hypothetical protein EHM76_06270 [bacterium]